MLIKHYYNSVYAEKTVKCVFFTSAPYKIIIRFDSCDLEM